MKRGKKYLEKSKLVDKANLYDLDAACALIPQVSTAKFDETVEAHIRLGVDSRLEVLLFSLTVLVRLSVFSYSLRVLRLTKLRQLVQIT